MAKVERDQVAAGRLLKALREEKGLSQRELSERTDGVVGPTHIARLETGHLAGKLHKIDALALALEMTKAQHALFRSYLGYGPDGVVDTPTIVKRLEVVEEQLADLKTDLGRLEGQLDQLLER